MTTQAQLIALADKHQEIPGVSALLVSIAEAQTAVRAHVRYVQSQGDVMLKASHFEDGFRAVQDSSDFVTAAAKASAAMSRLSADLCTLACVLQALGEDVVY